MYQSNNQNYCEATFKAIGLLYQAKINSEIQANSISYIDSICAIAQNYLDSLERSVVLLESVAASVKNKCYLGIVSLPVFSLLKRVNINEQKQLLEAWAGHYISYFGTSPLSSEQVESKLIENLSSTIQDLIKDFHLMYEDHFIFNLNIKTTKT